MLLAFPTEIIHSATPTIKVPVPIRMKHLCKFLRRRSFRTHRPCRRLLLFRTPNRRLRPRSRLLRIAIYGQRMPAVGSRRKPCERQHSNTME